jgi:hypothetical protein
MTRLVLLLLLVLSICGERTIVAKLDLAISKAYGCLKHCFAKRTVRNTYKQHCINNTHKMYRSTACMRIFSTCIMMLAYTCVLQQSCSDTRKEISLQLVTATTTAIVTIFTKSHTAAAATSTATLLLLLLLRLLLLCTAAITAHARTSYFQNRNDHRSASTKKTYRYHLC